MKKRIEVPKGKRLVFSRYRTDPRTGKSLDAWNYGLKAWPMLIDDDQPRLL